MDAIHVCKQKFVMQELIYSNDADIKQFIKTEGWVIIKANNPYIQGFYFNFNNSGSVSGDHFF